MADDKNKQAAAKENSGPVDITKGTSYRALTNIQLRGPVYVNAGQVFKLDDEDLEKFLLARGTISKDLKGAIVGRVHANVDQNDFNIAHEKRTNENADKGVTPKPGGEPLPGIVPNNR